MSRCRPSSRSPMFVGTFILVAAVTQSIALGGEKADALLRLLPPDSSMTVVAEDLTKHWERIRQSPLVKTAKTLPLVRRRQESEEIKKTVAALANLKDRLGIDVPSMADRLIGGAFVLSLQITPGAENERQGRGLLLVKAADRPLLETLINRLNQAQRDCGELDETVERRHKGTPYVHRTFQIDTKPPDWYAFLGTDTFAWSNSEVTIQEVIDRHLDCSQAKSPQPPVPHLDLVRKRLPPDSFLSFYVNPRSVEQILRSAPPPKKPEELQILAMINGYLGGVLSAGCSLVWRDGPVLYAEEVLDPDKLPAEFKAWGAAAPITKDAVLERVPQAALAMFHLQLDGPTLWKWFQRLLPNDSKRRVHNLRIALNGLLLGLDAETEVIPRLGPWTLGYIEPPENGPDSAWHWSKVVVIGIPAEEPGKVGKALANGLKTILALGALDEKRQAENLSVESRTIDGTEVAYVVPNSPFAFAVPSNRLVIGSTAESVARAVSTSNDPKQTNRFFELRSRFDEQRSKTPESSYGCVDLGSLRAFADKNRLRLTSEFAKRGNRPEAEVARDLEELLDLMSLFDAAFLTSRIEPGFVRVHRTVGLLGKSPTSTSP